MPQIIIILQRLQIQGCDTGVREGWPSSTNVRIRIGESEGMTTYMQWVGIEADYMDGKLKDVFHEAE